MLCYHKNNVNFSQGYPIRRQQPERNLQGIQGLVRNKVTSVFSDFVGNLSTKTIYKSQIYQEKIMSRYYFCTYEHVAST